MFRNFIIKTVLIVCIFSSFTPFIQALTSLSQHDPYPLFTTLPPYDFLDRNAKERLKHLEHEDICEYFGIHMIPFGMNAETGKDSLKRSTTIADIGGKTSLIGLLYGPVPVGDALPPLLATARGVLFPDVPLNTVINDPFGIDKNELFGFVSFDTCFRKRGVRFLAEARICDFHLYAAIGYADLCHT
ncbi:MAG: hypothetical protein WBQ73_04210, partial [Candidatus Babeliales bacterium]